MSEGPDVGAGVATGEVGAGVATGEVGVGERDGVDVGVAIGEVGVGEDVEGAVGDETGVAPLGAGLPEPGRGGTGIVCCPLILMVVAREINTDRPRIAATMTMIVSIVRKSSPFGGC